MQSVRQALPESVRTWLKSLQTQGKIGGKQWVVLVIFDNTTNTIFEGWSTDLTDEVIEHCVTQVYPRGSTKLYDSAVPALIAQQKRVALREKNFSRIQKMLGLKVTTIFTCMTDGEDNNSYEFTAHSMKEAVSKHRESGAVCQFLGGNFDAEYVGQQLGFTSDLSLQMDCDPVHFERAMMAVTSSSERAVSSGGALPPHCLRIYNSERCPVLSAPVSNCYQDCLRHFQNRHSYQLTHSTSLEPTDCLSSPNFGNKEYNITIR